MYWDWLIFVFSDPVIQNHVGYFGVFSSRLKTPSKHQLNKELPIGYFHQKMVLLFNLACSWKNCIFDLLKCISKLIHWDILFIKKLDNLFYQIFVLLFRTLNFIFWVLCRLLFDFKIVELLIELLKALGL